jgi:lipoyl-dependent peroxiredoxin
MATFSRQATVDWNGDVMHGAETVTAGTAAFALPVTFPHVGGEAAGNTTPEEILAASHAICFAIGLRSVIAQRGGKAERVRVTTTITAEKDLPGFESGPRTCAQSWKVLKASNTRTFERLPKRQRKAAPSRAIRGSVAISSEIAAS